MKRYILVLSILFIYTSGQAFASTFVEWTTENIQNEDYFSAIVERTSEYPTPTQSTVLKGENDINFSTGEWGLVYKKSGTYFFQTNNGKIAFGQEKKISLEGLTFSTEGINDCKNIILHNPKTNSTLFYHMTIMDLQSGGLKYVLDEKLDLLGKEEVQCTIVTSTSDNLSLLLDKLEERGISKISLDYGKVESSVSHNQFKIINTYGLGVRLAGEKLIDEKTGIELLGSGKSVLFKPSTGEVSLG